MIELEVLITPHIERIPEEAPWQFRNALVSIIQHEKFHRVPETGPTFAEQVAYRALVRKQDDFTRDRIFFEQAFSRVAYFIAGLAGDLPTGNSPFTVSYIEALPNAHAVVQGIVSLFLDEQYAKRGLFSEITARIKRNISEISGTDYDRPKKPLKFPFNSGLSPGELLDYVYGTPFDTLLSLPVPLPLTYDARFNHMHVLGGTGAGKTTLLENVLLHDLKSTDRPALVIVDSQGDLIRKLSHLKLWEEDDRLIIISPKDVDYPPALNIFDVNRDRLGSYDAATKEQVIAGVIQTFDYLFANLLGADLTAKQTVFFRFIARLMLALPETLGRNATILDMMALMEDATPYKDAITSLPAIPRAFFERDFQSKTFAQTKEQIRYRLQAIIENPTLARLFTAPNTRIDLFTELNRGSVILVDTAKDFLKGSSAHFGQIFISLVLQAILERAAIPEGDRKPTFLIIDEAAEYFDQNIDDLLTETRKFKCGLTLAHQYLDQASHGLRASLAANTGIKFAGGVSNVDARAMASDMHTTPDFILSQKRLHFAAHIRNATRNAVSIPVKTGTIDAEPQLTAEAYDALMLRNRAKVSLLETTPQPAPSVDTDEW